MKIVTSLFLALGMTLGLQAGTITSAGTLTNLTPEGFGIGTDVADLDAENIGRSGFVVFNSLPEGTNISNALWDEGIVDQRPAYVTALDGLASTSSGGWANYDDILVGGTTYNSGGIVRAGVGEGVESEVFNFSVNADVPSDLKIGILVDNSDSANWDATNIRLEGPGGATANEDVIIDGGSDLVQFNISGAVDGDIYTVYGTSAPSGVLIGAITFDAAADLSDPTDSDNDNMGDAWENFYFKSLGASDGTDDEDNDGASDLQEWEALSDPTKEDSDNDDLSDGDEINTHKTSPTDNDSDDDGYDDKFEVDNVASNFDPLVDDSAEDPDEDGLDNAAELANSTDAIDPDSDDDTIKDGDEVNGNFNPYNGGFFGVAPGDSTDPNNADSDGDNIDDFAEIDDANGFVTDPNNADTDGDAISDDLEIDNGSNPTDSASMPPVPAGLISVDLQGNPDGAAFNPDPVLMSGFEDRAGFFTGVWNDLSLPGHPNVGLDPSFDLVDARGDASGVTFSLMGTISSWTNAAGADPLTNDYLFVNAGNADPSAAWEISGLAGGSDFTLFCYGGVARDMLLTVDTNGDGNLDDETPSNVDAAGFEFTGTTGGDGKIIGSIDPGESGEANWGGFQLIHAGSALGGLRITDLNFREDDSVALTWTSSPGRSYAVEASSDLENWSDILTEIDAEASPATTTTVIVDTPAADEAKKHYRVREE